VWRKRSRSTQINQRAGRITTVQKRGSAEPRQLIRVSHWCNLSWLELGSNLRSTLNLVQLIRDLIDVGEKRPQRIINCCMLPSANVGWLSSVLCPHQHNIGYCMGDTFTGQKAQPTVSKYWRRQLQRKQESCAIAKMTAHCALYK